jgi:hypothetical protein
MSVEALSIEGGFGQLKSTEINQNRQTLYFDIDE